MCTRAELVRRDRCPRARTGPPRGSSSGLHFSVNLQTDKKKKEILARRPRGKVLAEEKRSRG